MTQKIKIRFLFVVLVAFLAAGALNIFILNLNQNKEISKKEAKSEFVRIIIEGKTEINAEVLRTDLEKIKGLSGRAVLPQNQGALFVYERPGFYNFWMKEMHFPIDIIWLVPNKVDKTDDNFKVVDVTREVRPESYPESFSSKLPAQYVLEVNAGFAKKYGLKAGSNVKIEGL